MPVCSGHWRHNGATEKAMMRSNVEHALGMMRIYFVECAIQHDWNDHRSDELARTIVDCLRQS